MSNVIQATPIFSIKREIHWREEQMLELRKKIKIDDVIEDYCISYLMILNEVIELKKELRNYYVS